MIMSNWNGPFFYSNPIVRHDSKTIVLWIDILEILGINQLSMSRSTIVPDKSVSSSFEEELTQSVLDERLILILDTLSLGSQRFMPHGLNTNLG